MNLSRKQKEYKFRRNLILESAGKLFKQKGFENVSMEEIAQHADFSRQTLYSYFQNRDELFIIVFLKQCIDRWKFLNQEVIRGKTGYEKLKLMGEAYYAYFKERPEELKFCLYWDYQGIDENNIREEIIKEFNEPDQKEIERYNAIFIKGVEDKSIKPDLNYYLIGALFMNMLRMVLHQVINLKYLPEKYYFEILDFFLNAIKNK